jgi:probable HAF family extracellular repeat protein
MKKRPCSRALLHILTGQKSVKTKAGNFARGLHCKRATARYGSVNQEGGMRFAFVALVCSCALSISTNGAARYIAMELRFRDADSVSVSDLNDHGTAVGSVWRGGLQRGFIANRHRVTYLDRFFPGTNTAATRINNRGQVIGYVADSTGPDGMRWFIYQTNTVQLMNALDGQTILDLGDINDRGEITGHCTPGEGVFTFIYTDGKLVLLSQLPGNDRGHPWLRLNNLGQVVAYDDYGGTIHTTNSVTGLPFENNSTGINDRGDVVGAAVFGTGNGAFEAGFLYADGMKHFIGGLPHAVNEKRQVVGYQLTGDQTYGYLYEDGGWFNLDFLAVNGAAFHLVNPSAINERGMIACDGVRDGQSCAFILVPMVRRYIQFWRDHSSTVPSYVNPLR